MEVVTQSPVINVFKDRWPALFSESQIKEEFHRITTISLEETFMRKLDVYTPCLLQLMRGKGGVAGSRMCPLLDTINQGEHEDHTDQTMKVLVVHNPLAEKDPAEVSVVIEGNRVLNGCGNRTKACVLLMGLIYGLNLEYPKMLKNTFAVFQKTFLEFDGAKLPRKVNSLKGKLMKCT
ncbi:hypothetical protein AMECASPLE_023522 [Ameca splendens]|uniref:Uncharacterized protein n=1 Tax=Ameca splendens TaxID=208324 RepID=A0ABV0XH41_9TELE